ncbi:hypothetical protein TWF694_008741 [Orbilia ellipsospora]|uniref:polynucleotide adenylyltransferase n=1 Tax=Orbilia ellipsospora TaxID=2528407 RepID=A0AAV9XE22_9PEZI
MEDNQSPPFHQPHTTPLPLIPPPPPPPPPPSHHHLISLLQHSVTAPPTGPGPGPIQQHPSIAYYPGYTQQSAAPYSHAFHQPSQSDVAPPTVHPAAAATPLSALLASAYAFAPPIPSVQYPPALYPPQQLVTSPSGQSNQSRRISLSSKSPNQNRPTTEESYSLSNSSAAPLNPSSSLPAKPKKAKTPARLAREMARKLKHRERRRIGRRERRNASKKGDGEGDEFVALEGENASQSDEVLDEGSESGELDDGSPTAGDPDLSEKSDGNHRIRDGTDNAGGSTFSSSITSPRDLDNRSPAADLGNGGAIDSRRPSITVSEAESGAVSSRGSRAQTFDGTNDRRYEDRFRRDSDAQRHPPIGPRFQPPSGPRNTDVYQFGRDDRSSSRPYRDEDNFRFESDSRGLNFPPTESGFRDRRYRDGDRRFGDRRGFHTDAPHRFNDTERAPRAPLPAHDRPLLRLRRSATPEQFPAMVAAKRQRMEDEGEVEMDIDSPSGSSVADDVVLFSEPIPEDNQEIALTEAVALRDENSVPETSTPAETADSKEQPGKKLDVISMIRKAKKELSSNRKDTSAASGDFISLSGLDDDNSPVKSVIPGLENVPTGPRIKTNSGRERLAELGTSTSRKRSFSEIEPPRMDLRNTPWFKPLTVMNHTVSLYPAVTLHKEIIDFCKFMKPLPFEHIVRHDIVRRVKAVVNRLWRDADVQSFGSFANETYLPTSDMDLVVLSNQFIESGMPKYHNNSNIRKLYNALASARIAKPNTLAAITGARVPLIKFKDGLTGISVDISFENPSGIVANRTIKQWKEVYPEMPKLAMLLKHFLVVKNLNDPANGGMGSLAIMCMIVSMLQVLPEAASGNWHDGENVSLGRLLMEFLQLYGTKFNTTTTCIRAKTPGYFKKGLRHGAEYYNPSRPWLLVIEDPNTPGNNITKATSRILEIQKEFARSYETINTKMNRIHSLPFELRKNESLLADMLGGYNYTNAIQQRKQMSRIFISSGLGTAEDLEKLGGQDLDTPMPNLTLNGDTPTDELLGRFDSLAPQAPARSRGVRSFNHKKKELKKQRRAAKVQSRAGQGDIPSGTRHIHTHAQAPKKKKQKKGKGTQP